MQSLKDTERWEYRMKWYQRVQSGREKANGTGERNPLIGNRSHPHLYLFRWQRTGGRVARSELIAWAQSC